MDEYEYAAQWYPGTHDSWIRDEWHTVKWTTRKEAEVYYDYLLARNKGSIPDDLRIVRRRKAGPVEVIG